ncbi:IclR family transcriptional regulator domain-containing protein [Streptomyces sp. HGB0020]|uniref:IclR family transcriptional regulator domain-containing protein n=1 Tax=Streptomyces sp. HGB0020 TaxID=1078086 RepID=UPI0009980618|nr:IclR family transcriptional regulator C-terminal domain-containing protein [Streptomyces sp. HGB0020]
MEHVCAPGWSFIESEREVGPTSVAAPVAGFDGLPQAALAIGGPSVRLDRAEAERVGPIVAATARAMAVRMGHLPAQESADV